MTDNVSTENEPLDPSTRYPTPAEPDPDIEAADNEDEARAAEAEVEEDAANDDDAGEEDEDKAEAESDGDDEDEDEHKSRNRIPASKRIAQLTYRLREAERTIAQLQGQQDTAAGDKPDPTQYEDEAEYAADLAAWRAEQRIAERQNKTKTDDLAKAEENRKTAMAETFNARVAEVEDQYEDFEKVAFHGWDPDANLIDAVMLSEHGPAVAYYLGSNPDKAAELNGMSPVEAGMAVGRLGAELSQPKTKRNGKAPPPPPRTLKGKGGTPKPDPDDLSDDQWYRERIKRETRAAS